MVPLVKEACEEEVGVPQVDKAEEGEESEEALAPAARVVVLMEDPVDTRQSRPLSS